MKVRVKEVCYDVAATYQCVGETANVGGASGGSLTEKWVTNSAFIAL